VLAVSTNEPSYTDFDDGTAENANLLAGIWRGSGRSQSVHIHRLVN